MALEDVALAVELLKLLLIIGNIIGNSVDIPLDTGLAVFLFNQVFFKVVDDVFKNMTCTIVLTAFVGNVT